MPHKAVMTEGVSKSFLQRLLFRHADVVLEEIANVFFEAGVGDEANAEGAASIEIAFPARDNSSTGAAELLRKFPSRTVRME